MLSRIPPKTLEKLYDKPFKDYREYKRYVAEKQMEQTEKFQKDQCENLREQFINGDISREQFIKSCASVICDWHQEGIEPWSGELYLDKYPSHQRLDELDDAERDIKKSIRKGEDHLRGLYKLKNIGNRISVLERKLVNWQDSGAPEDEIKYLTRSIGELRKLQSLQTEDDKKLLDSDIKREKQYIKDLRIQLSRFQKDNREEIDNLKSEVNEIDREAEEVCKSIQVSDPYNSLKERNRADMESRECGFWVNEGKQPSFGQDPERCVPEICEKFREDPNKHPLTGENLLLGGKSYNDIIDLCDNYFDYLYNVPAILKIPKRVKQFPLTDEGNFSLYPLLPRIPQGKYFGKYGLLDITRPFFSGGDASFTLFSMMYLISRHNNLCLPYREDLKVDRDILLGKDIRSNYSIFNITWSMKSVDKYTGILELVRDHTQYNKSVLKNLADTIYNIAKDSSGNIEELVNTINDITSTNNLQDLDISLIKNPNIQEIQQALIVTTDYNSILATRLHAEINTDKPLNLDAIKELLDEYNAQYDDKFMSILEEIKKFPLVTRNTLYYNSDIFTKIAQCIKEGKRFVYLHLSIQTPGGAHSNAILYDTQTKILERFDPMGTHPQGEWKLPSGETIELNEPIMDNAIYELFLEKGLPVKSYITPITFCPIIGLQTLEGKRRYEREPPGYCSVWVTIYIDARLTYPDISPNVLIQSMITELTQKQITRSNIVGRFVDKLLFGNIQETFGFKEFVKDYTNYITYIKYNTERYIQLYGDKDISIGDYLDIVDKTIKSIKFAL